MVSCRFSLVFLGFHLGFHLRFHVGFLIKISYQDFQTFMWVSLGLIEGFIERFI